MHQHSVVTMIEVSAHPQHGSEFVIIWILLRESTLLLGWLSAYSIPIEIFRLFEK